MKNDNTLKLSTNVTIAIKNNIFPKGVELNSFKILGCIIIKDITKIVRV